MGYFKLIQILGLFVFIATFIVTYKCTQSKKFNKKLNINIKKNQFIVDKKLDRVEKYIEQEKFEAKKPKKRSLSEEQLKELRRKEFRKLRGLF